MRKWRKLFIFHESKMCLDQFSKPTLYINKTRKKIERVELTFVKTFYL